MSGETAILQKMGKSDWKSDDSESKKGRIFEPSRNNWDLGIPNSSMVQKSPCSNGVGMFFDPLPWSYMHYHLVGGLVAIFYFPIYWEFHHPNWLSYFSEGFKPPTSHAFSLSLSTYHTKKYLHLRWFFSLEDGATCDQLYRSCQVVPSGLTTNLAKLTCVPSRNAHQFQL